MAIKGVWKEMARNEFDYEKKEYFMCDLKLQ
jgi:hypothetical protein